MATPIASLPQRTVLDGNEQIPVQSSGRQTQKVLLSAIQSYLSGSYLYNSSITAVGTGANTTETDLISETITGNTILVEGTKLILDAWGDFGTNGDTKRVRVKVDGTTHIDTTAAVFNGAYWEVHLEIKVVDNANVIISGQFIAFDSTTGAIATFPIQASQAIDLTSDFDIVVSGQNGASTANDVRMKSYDVKIETVF